jgi:hypothetical protein
MTAVDAFAGYVARHEGQPWRSKAHQIEVIAQLPGPFVRKVEVQILDIIGREADGITRHRC